MDLGSVNAPPPLEHRDSGVGWSNCRKIMKRIKNNDLTHYFLSDHSQLPASYLASCEKFFKSLSCKPQAPSPKLRRPQAASFKLDSVCRLCYRRFQEKEI